VSETTSWLDDPRLARRLARFTWVLLVAVFVVLTRFDFGDSVERVALAGLITVVGLLNAPVMVGLWRSRDESRTSAFRLVAFALALRLLATGWVVWMVPAS
jgi:hypothetical protein